jgi:hypothetical protein
VVGVPDATLPIHSRWDNHGAKRQTNFLKYFDWLFRLDWEEAGERHIDCVLDLTGRRRC